MAELEDRATAFHVCADQLAMLCAETSERVTVDAEKTASLAASKRLRGCIGSINGHEIK